MSSGASEATGDVTVVVDAAEPVDADSVDAGPVDAEPADPVAEMKAALRRAPGEWYVVHSYAGYENKVKANLETRVQNLDLEDYIFQVEVPTEEVTEIKNGQRKQQAFHDVSPDRLYRPLRRTCARLSRPASGAARGGDAADFRSAHFRAGSAVLASVIRIRGRACDSRQS